MRDAGYFHCFDFFIDKINYAVIADANTPLIPSALEFLAALRSWIDSENFDLRQDTGNNEIRESKEFFFRAGGQQNMEFSHAVFHSESAQL
jgi:hypothetical protein